MAAARQTRDDQAAGNRFSPSASLETRGLDVFAGGFMVSRMPAESGAPVVSIAPPANTL